MLHRYGLSYLTVKLYLITITIIGLLVCASAIVTQSTITVSVFSHSVSENFNKKAKGLQPRSLCCGLIADDHLTVDITPGGVASQMAPSHRVANESEGVGL